MITDEKSLLKILTDVKNTGLTPKRALRKIYGISTARISQRLKARKGDRLKCLYGDSGHKFWNKLLNQCPTVDRVRHTHVGISQVTFKEDTFEDNWFYENDFVKHVPKSKSKKI